MADRVALQRYAQDHRLYRRESSLPYLYRGYAREAIAEMRERFGCDADEAVDAIRSAHDFEGRTAGEW